MVADLLQAAAEHFQFAPQRPANELEFKRAYARVALAAGLTREQAVRVYSFETGGNGNHDMQSGLSASRPGSRAISTAIGYNQLLTTNSVELVAEQGHEILKVADRQGRAIVRRRRARRWITRSRCSSAWWRSRARCRTTGSAHEKLADTPQGWAVHAMVLDIDVGPLLQTHKLLTSVIFARAKGYTRPLTAAELEMMNLTGDGTGLDMVTMPQAMREQVPTSNFFQRGGYERNPVAIRHNTVAKLLAVTDAPDGQQQPAAGRQGTGGGVLVPSSSLAPCGAYVKLAAMKDACSQSRTERPLERLGARTAQGSRLHCGRGTSGASPGPNMNLPSPSRYGPVRM